MSEVHTLKVFHLDDDPFQLDRVHAALEKNAIDGEFHVSSFEEPAELLQKIREGHIPDVVILDIHVDERKDGGIVVAKEVRQLTNQTTIIMCSNADDVRTITKCLTSGADDFISKNSDRGELSLRVLNSYHLAQSKKGRSTAQDLQVLHRSSLRSLPLHAGQTCNGIAGRMPRIIASAISTMHVSGESGVGKEIVADILEAHLPDKTPFVRVNCAAISPGVIESELFGHIKGAFTGAVNERRGYFESASGGWIFLDEVATLSLSTQAALLRVIENQEVIRVGSTTALPINIRILSAANQSLAEMVGRGQFRQDLWQRLCEIEIKIPPLRERKEEIPAIIEYFVSQMPKGPYQITRPALEILAGLEWSHGNVRELRNCLRAMTEFQVDRLLTPLSIPAHILEQEESREGDVPLKTSETGRQNQSFQVEYRSLEKFEDAEDRLLVAVIENLAQRQGGKLSLRSLSRELSIARSTLSERCRRISAKGLITFERLALMVNISES